MSLLQLSQLLCLFLMHSRTHHRGRARAHTAINAHHTLKRVAAITHSHWDQFVAGVSEPHWWESSASNSHQHLTSHFYRLLPSAYLRPPSSSLPDLPAPPRLISPQFFMIWPIIICPLKKQQRSPPTAVLMVVHVCGCVCKCSKVTWRHLKSPSDLFAVAALPVGPICPCHNEWRSERGTRRIAPCLQLCKQRVISKKKFTCKWKNR